MPPVRDGAAQLTQCNCRYAEGFQNLWQCCCTNDVERFPMVCDACKSGKHELLAIPPDDDD